MIANKFRQVLHRTHPMWLIVVVLILISVANLIKISTAQSQTDGLPTARQLQSVSEQQWQIHPSTFPLQRSQQSYP